MDSNQDRAVQAAFDGFLSAGDYARLEAKIEADAKVIAALNADIASMIAVHNSDVDGMRLQEEKIAAMRGALRNTKVVLIREKLDGLISAESDNIELMDLINAALGINEQSIEEQK